MCVCVCSWRQHCKFAKTKLFSFTANKLIAWWHQRQLRLRLIIGCYKNVILLQAKARMECWNSCYFCSCSLSWLFLLTFYFTMLWLIVTGIWFLFSMYFTTLGYQSINFSRTNFGLWRKTVNCRFFFYRWNEVNRHYYVEIIF